MKQNTAFKLKFFLVLSSDGKTGATGKSPAVALQKGTASFAAADGTIAEKAYGWYIFSGTVNDSDTLGEVAAHITATDCDPVDIKFYVEQTDATDIAAIKAKTDNLPADPASNTQVNTRLASSGYTAPANSDITAIKSKTDNLPSSPASETTATAIKSKTDNLPADPASNTQVNTRLAASGYTAPANSDITAIKSKTDNLPASPAAVSNIPTAGAIADAVCDEALSGHTTAGSVGAALTAAGSAGDPWSTSLPGSYGNGTAGKILGGYVAPANSDIAAIKTKTDNLPASPANETTVAAVKSKTDNLPSDPASNTQVNTRLASSGYTSPDNSGITAIKNKTDNLPSSPASETTVTAVKTKTDNLPSDPASNTQVNTRLAASGYTAPANSDIAAIKSKTDNLPASPAAVSNIPTAATIADAICDEALSGHATAGTVGAALTTASSDHWATSLPGSYGNGTAGKILGGYVAPANSDISAIKAKTDNLPADPASNTQVNTRLATAGYTAPANSDITAIKNKTDNLPSSPANETTVAAVKAKTDNLPSDPASNTQVNTRLATAGYTAPANSDIAAIKAKTDNLPADPASNTQVNTRLATSGYTAPDNSNISAIKSKTDNLPADPASNTQVNTRLAASGYTAPANSDIAAIKAKTDNLPASPAAVSDIPTAIQNADAILTRDVSHVEAVAGVHSFAYVILALSESDTTAHDGFLTVYRTDGVTEFVRKALQHNSSADWITGIS